MESKQWKKLPVDDLWIKSSFTQDSYSIWLTDLCQLYAEELDADDFRWRATKAKLPIDVDEAANLATVLKTLSQAVEDDRLKLPSSLGKSRTMDLNATVHLPKPLPNINWTIKLELQQDDRFRDAVSKPLLDRIDTFEQREEDLIHRLHDKDHTIEKLLDILEKYSVDLADVFPSLASHGANRRSHSRRDAEAHIPALQAFDKHAWHESIAKGKRYETPKPAERTESGSFESMPASSVEVTHEGKKPASTSTINGKLAVGGIKRTLGSGQTPTPGPVASDTESEKPSRPANTPPPAPKSKGIKRTLGGRKAEPTSEPTAGSATATDASEPESSKPPAAEKPKGIKRTLGGRRDQTKEHETSPLQTTNETSNGKHEKEKATEQKPDEAVDEAVDEDDVADRKREALKRQLANAGAVKSKKRKF